MSKGKNAIKKSERNSSKYSWRRDKSGERIENLGDEVDQKENEHVYS